MKTTTSKTSHPATTIVASTIKKSALFIIIIMAAIGLALSVACKPPSYPDGLEPMPKAHKLARALWREAYLNPVRFSAQYGGDTVQAVGEISVIKNDGNIWFKPPNWTSREILVCDFEDIQQVMELQRFQEIAIEGKIKQVNGKIVYLSECRNITTE